MENLDLLVSVNLRFTIIQYNSGTIAVYDPNVSDGNSSYQVVQEFYFEPTPYSTYGLFFDRYEVSCAQRGKKSSWYKRVYRHLRGDKVHWVTQSLRGYLVFAGCPFPDLATALHASNRETLLKTGISCGFSVIQDERGYRTRSFLGFAFFPEEVIQAYLETQDRNVLPNPVCCMVRQRGLVTGPILNSLYGYTTLVYRALTLCGKSPKEYPFMGLPVVLERDPTRVAHRKLSGRQQSGMSFGEIRPYVVKSRLMEFVDTHDVDGLRAFLASCEEQYQAVSWLFQEWFPHVVSTNAKQVQDTFTMWEQHWKFLQKPDASVGGTIPVQDHGVPRGYAFQDQPEGNRYVVQGRVSGGWPHRGSPGIPMAPSNPAPSLQPPQRPQSPQPPVNERQGRPRELPYPWGGQYPGDAHELFPV